MRSMGVTWLQRPTVSSQHAAYFLRLPDGITGFDRMFLQIEM